MNYMWSHGIADASDGFGHVASVSRTWAAAPATAAAADIDVRHTLTTNGVWELPFGHGKQYLTERSGFPDSWRLVALRAGHGAHRNADQHHDFAQSRGPAGRQHLRPAAELGARRVDLRGESEHSEPSGSTRRRSPLPRMEPGATWAATSPTARTITNSIPGCRSAFA